LDDETVSQRFSPVGDSRDFQPVSIRPKHGRNNCHPLAGFGERQQCVRRAALEQNVRLDVGKTASGIEQAPNRVTGVEQQQWMGCEGHDINHAVAGKLE
jgi:hypothetical protein